MSLAAPLRPMAHRCPWDPPASSMNLHQLWQSQRTNLPKIARLGWTVQSDNKILQDLRTNFQLCANLTASPPSEAYACRGRTNLYAKITDLSLSSLYAFPPSGAGRPTDSIAALFLITSVSVPASVSSRML